MPSDVISSIYQTRSVTDLPRYSGQAFDNHLLRIGEVVRIIEPEDPDSQSHRFKEYDVIVTHLENGTAVPSKLYQNCLLANPFGGLADSLSYTLRVDPSQGAATNASHEIRGGLGSKVLIHCINAAHAAAVIVGGVRDPKDTDVGTKALGHHLKFQFNGVEVLIRSDGSCQLTTTGATAADGNAAASRDKDGAGAALELKANGNIEARAPGGKQTVIIDHKAGTTTITGDQILNLDATRINTGLEADEHQLLGDTTIGLLGDFLDAVSQLTVISPTGATSVPVNIASFKAIRAKLKTALSQLAYIKAKR